MKKLLSLSFFLFFGNLLFAQYSISGTVVTSINQPLEGVSVYFNNTSIGTTTDEDGFFEINFRLQYPYELVFSYLGFQTQVFQLDYEKLDLPFEIKLLPKNNVLDEIVVFSKMKKITKSDREYYLELFRNNFIGKTEFSKKCTILNEEDIRFKVDPNTKDITAFFKKPIRVKNEALGYLVYYDFVLFELVGKRVSYLGYTRFNELKGSKRKKRRWKKNRLKAYEGSLTHFLRAIRMNKLEQEGFKVDKYEKIVNPERPSETEIELAKKILDKERNEKGVISLKYSNSKRPAAKLESAMATLRKARRDKYIRRLLVKDVQADDIVVRKNGKIFLYFENYLKVRYMIDPEEYGFRPGGYRLRYQGSWLYLLNTNSQILMDGVLSDPLSVLNEGYWSYEKMGETLPLDYSPYK